MGNHQCLTWRRVRVAYTGTEALTFSQYMDAETGRTLHAVPGGFYDIIPASGHAVPDVPEPWFVAVQDEVPVPETWAAEPDAVPEPEPQPETDEAQDNPEPAPESVQF